MSTPPHPGSIAVSGFTEWRSASRSPCQNHRNQGHAGRAGRGRSRRRRRRKDRGRVAARAALKAARERPADPTVLVLAEVSALRYMFLNFFHATAQANAEGKHLLPDSVVKIRDQANARKSANALKLLAEFLSQEEPDRGKK